MKGIKRERVKGRGIERESERKKIERKRRFLLQFNKYFISFLLIIS